MDREKALAYHEFPDAHYLTCFIHVRRKIKRKVQDGNVPANLSIDILIDVLGNNIGTTYVEGLVDAKIINKLDVVTKKWSNSELTSASEID
uniref:Uncharacterized protein n=1 Tax=Amphimedon queenslandica TaxID=400682 RepID=A0A1X7TU18_AMPQE